MTNLPSDLSAYLEGRIKVVNDCWEWQGANKDGYGALTYKQKNYRAHRFAFEVQYGRKPVGFLLHSCDNPPCVNPVHLREGTHWENMQDMKDRNRHPKGEGSYNAILNEQAVKALRFLHSKGYGYGRLGKAYGLSRWTIRSAVSGAAWRHLEN